MPLFVYSFTYLFTFFMEILPSAYTGSGFRHTIVKPVGMICFENANSSQRDWYIREQFEYITKFMFTNVWFLPQETLHECSKLHPAEPSCVVQNANTRPCLKHLPVSQFHNESEAAILLAPASMSKLHLFFFFKVKCYIYSDIYIFLSHLTCIKTMPPF